MTDVPAANDLPTPPCAEPLASAARGFVSPLHSGLDLPRYHATHVLAAVFPFTAGLALYGWRAAATVAATMASAAAGLVLWRRVGARGRQLRLTQALWFALLLGLMLPAHLFSRVDAGGYPGVAEGIGAAWPILIGAGLVLVALLWALGGLGAGRVHPVLVTYLLIAALFAPALTPHRILQRDHLVTGDLFATPPPAPTPASTEPWVRATPPGGGDAQWVEPAAAELSAFTRGTESQDRYFLTLDVLLRDRMPTLEDLIVAGQPGGIGTSSVIAVIIGGLFLLYRGMIDFRVPLVVFAVAYVALVLLPVPVVLSDRAEYRWLALRSVGWPTALTFVHYELLAGPLAFVAFFLATAPNIRPLVRRARTTYAALVGLLAAVMQLYVSVSFGAYVALLLASLVTPLIDKWRRPKPLV